MDLRNFKRGAKEQGDEFPTRPELSDGGRGKRSVRPGAGGSQALLRVLTQGSSSIQTGGKRVIQGSRGPGTGFWSFAEYSRVLHGSGKLPEAASPAGRVRTQTAAGSSYQGGGVTGAGVGDSAQWMAAGTQDQVDSWAVILAGPGSRSLIQPVTVQQTTDPL